mgnify:CR=1 FL=1
MSAQVQTKSGVQVLQAVTFELFSRVQFGTAVGGERGRATPGATTSRCAACGRRTRSLQRRVADLEVQLQQEHALAARSEQLQALLDLKSQATVPTLAAEVIAGEPGPGHAHGDHRPRQRRRRAGRTWR